MEKKPPPLSTQISFALQVHPATLRMRMSRVLAPRFHGASRTPSNPRGDKHGAVLPF